MKTILDSIIKVEQDIQKVSLDAQQEADKIVKDAKNKADKMESEMGAQFESDKEAAYAETEKKSGEYETKLLKEMKDRMTAKTAGIDKKRKSIVERITKEVIGVAK